MKKLVIVGDGGFAREVFWLIEEINKQKDAQAAPYQVLGFVGKSKESRLHGVPILGDDQWAFENLPQDVRFVVAIGDSYLRATIAVDYLEKGFRPVRLVHPRACLSDEVQLGGGAIISAGAVLTTDIKVGEFAVVNLNATVGHDCEIGDFVTVHPGANLSGRTVLEDFVVFGSGAVTLPAVRVGKGAVVGAGAVVTKDLAGGKTYVGTPARVIG